MAMDLYIFSFLSVPCSAAGWLLVWFNSSIVLGSYLWAELITVVCLQTTSVTMSVNIKMLTFIISSLWSAVWSREDGQKGNQNLIKKWNRTLCVLIVCIYSFHLFPPEKNDQAFNIDFHPSPFSIYNVDSTCNWFNFVVELVLVVMVHPWPDKGKNEE